MSAEKQSQNVIPKHIPVSNFMLDLMKAVDKDQSTLSEQQVLDAKSTEIAVQIEANLYKYWMNELSVVTKEIANYKYWAKQSGRSDSGELAYLTKFYALASAHAQSMESQQDGAVQADQGQTSMDATNLQMKAQMVQGVNSILSTLVNLLGRITA
ncbi:MAG: hypothetical protein K1000chlam3_01751 [Chlamydiae bacterium]|nr:hypothetical protein [Chlamydiota bacterium]